jgi:hypothetical protein
VARESLEAAQLQRKLSPEYDDCGRICALTGKRQKELCDGCAVKTVEDGFRSDCLEYFKEVENNEKYDFDSILSDYYSICALESTVGDVGYGSDWSVLTCRLVDILRSERNRVRRIADWKFEKKLNSSPNS